MSCVESIARNLIPSSKYCFRLRKYYGDIRYNDTIPLVNMKNIIYNQGIYETYNGRNIIFVYDNAEDDKFMHENNKFKYYLYLALSFAQELNAKHTYIALISNHDEDIVNDFNILKRNISTNDDYDTKMNFVINYFDLEKYNMPYISVNICKMIMNTNINVFNNELKLIS